MAGLIFRAAFLYIESNAARFWSSASGMAVIYALFGLYFTYFPFIYVAIWRSANRYRGTAVWAVLAKVAVVLGGFMLLKTAHDMYRTRIEQLNVQTLAETAAVINRSLPVMVDEGTRLDRTQAHSSSLEYQDTLIRISAAQLDADSFRETMQARLKKNVCTSTQTKAFLDAGIRLVFNYRSSDGQDVASIAVAPSDCNAGGQGEQTQCYTWVISRTGPPNAKRLPAGTGADHAL